MLLTPFISFREFHSGPKNSERVKGIGQIHQKFRNITTRRGENDKSWGRDKGNFNSKIPSLALQILWLRFKSTQYINYSSHLKKVFNGRDTRRVAVLNLSTLQFLLSV